MCIRDSSRYHRLLPLLQTTPNLSLATIYILIASQRCYFSRNFVKLSQNLYTRPMEDNWKYLGTYVGYSSYNRTDLLTQKLYNWGIWNLVHMHIKAYFSNVYTKFQLFILKMTLPWTETWTWCSQPIPIQTCLWTSGWIFTWDYKNCFSFWKKRNLKCFHVFKETKRVLSVILMTFYGGQMNNAISGTTLLGLLFLMDFWMGSGTPCLHFSPWSCKFSCQWAKILCVYWKRMP